MRAPERAVAGNPRPNTTERGAVHTLQLLVPFKVVLQVHQVQARGPPHVCVRFYFLQTREVQLVLALRLQQREPIGRLARHYL